MTGSCSLLKTPLCVGILTGALALMFVVTGVHTWQTAIARENVEGALFDPHLGFATRANEYIYYGLAGVWTVAHLCLWVCSRCMRSDAYEVTG